MKKGFVYLTILILSFAGQACNNNSAPDKSTSVDSTTTQSTGNDTTLSDSTIKQSEAGDTDTSTNKNAVRIATTEVPGSVVAAFNSKYPNAAHIRWLQVARKKKTIYRARWQTDGKKMTAIFTGDGKFLKEKQPK